MTKSKSLSSVEMLRTADVPEVGKKPFKITVVLHEANKPNMEA